MVVRTLILHAKAPIVGGSKSRLVAPEIGLDAGAVAALSAAFLQDTLATCREVAVDELVVHFTPAGSAAYFRELAGGAILEPQVEGGFGDRVRTVFARAFARGPRHAIIVGMDTPHLSASTIEAAFLRLADHDVVLGPSTDGGYYLLGMRRRCDVLFEGIDWSTSAVARQTLERAAGAGLVVAEIDETFDVDTIDDLKRLKEVVDSQPERCRHTAAWLEANPQCVASAIRPV